MPVQRHPDRVNAFPLAKTVPFVTQDVQESLQILFLVLLKNSSPTADCFGLTLTEIKCLDIGFLKLPLSAGIDVHFKHSVTGHNPMLFRLRVAAVHPWAEISLVQTWYCSSQYCHTLSLTLVRELVASSFNLFTQPSLHRFYQLDNPLNSFQKTIHISFHCGY